MWLQQKLDSLLYCTTVLVMLTFKAPPPLSLLLWPGLLINSIHYHVTITSYCLPLPFYSILISTKWHLQVRFCVLFLPNGEAFGRSGGSVISLKRWKIHDGGAKGVIKNTV